MKINRKIIAYMIIIFFLINIIPAAESITDRNHLKIWWNKDWHFRKVITIENPINEYQLFINISSVKGGDVTFDKNCNYDFSDIRFIAEDNTNVLSYWIEKIEYGHYAWFWVKLPNNIESNNKMFIYYGNSNAQSISNGYDTFLWFDDFTTDSTDQWLPVEMNDTTGKWHYYNTNFYHPHNKSRLRTKVDCESMNSRNWAGSTFLGLKYQYDNIYGQRLSIQHSYNSDFGAIEESPATRFYSNNQDDENPSPFDNVLQEGDKGYILEQLYSHSDSFTEGRIYNSQNELLFNQILTENIQDNLRYIIIHITDYHKHNGGTDSGLYYDDNEDQLIVKAIGSHYAPDDSWLELHYSWMFLSSFSVTEPSFKSVRTEQMKRDSSNNNIEIPFFFRNFFEDIFDIQYQIALSLKKIIT